MMILRNVSLTPVYNRSPYLCDRSLLFCDIALVKELRQDIPNIKNRSDPEAEITAYCR
ncbi:hypothetical protein [Nostoc sp.]|uniref:hypothetical protein n=1 Tax=Nostoc sp. TaxID=1180 RepID=UPI002FF4C4D2